MIIWKKEIVPPANWRIWMWNWVNRINCATICAAISLAAKQLFKRRSYSRPLWLWKKLFIQSRKFLDKSKAIVKWDWLNWSIGNKTLRSVIEATSLDPKCQFEELKYAIKVEKDHNMQIGKHTDFKRESAKNTSLANLFRWNLLRENEEKLKLQEISKER